mgnify:CR=1 FL=1
MSQLPGSNGVARALKKRTRQELDSEAPRSFSWYQYLTVPLCMRKLNIYRLHELPDFTPADFQRFQDHLLALGITSFADDREPEKSFKTSHIPSKFYAYFVGRLETIPMLHLFLFGYLNQTVPQELLSNFNFFKRNSNENPVFIPSSPKKLHVQIKFTESYRTPSFGIMESMRDIFICSKNFWLSRNHRKRMEKREHRLLCELQFDEEVNKVRNMFLITCIRGGVSKDVIASYCASQFLGRPIKNWKELFCSPGDIDDEVEDAVPPQVSNKPNPPLPDEAENPKPKDPENPWLWSMDPREYLLKTWHFWASITPGPTDFDRLGAFVTEIQEMYGPTTMFCIKDVQGERFHAYDHPKFLQTFGPPEERWKVAREIFSAPNIYNFFKFGYGKNKLMEEVVEATLTTTIGTKIKVKIQVLRSTPKRFIGVVVLEAQEASPVVTTLLNIAGVTGKPAEPFDWRGLHDGFRFLAAMPTSEMEDTSSASLFYERVHLIYAHPEKNSYIEVFDLFLPSSRAHVRSSTQTESSTLSSRLGLVKQWPLSIQTVFHLLWKCTHDEGGVELNLNLGSGGTGAKKMDAFIIPSGSRRYIAVAVRTAKNVDEEEPAEGASSWAGKKICL